MARRSPGEGSVFRRKADGAWIAQVSLGPREDRRYRSRSAKSRADAVRKLRDLQLELKSGVDPSRLTTGAYLSRWVNDARNIRDSTRAGYADVVSYHLNPAIGHIRLAALTPLHVERMLADLTVSPKYARNIHATLRRALGQAVRAGLVSRNVAAREFIDAPRVPSTEPEALSGAQVLRLRVAWEGDRLQGLFELGLLCGLRLGELLGLSWGDVVGGIHVRRELVRRDGHYYLEEPKTPRSVRTIPMTPEIAAALAAHREVIKPKVPIATGPVFEAESGGPLNGSWVTHHFYDLCAEAGIERKPFKILRATFATRLQEQRVPDTTIAALMGHTRTHTTRKHYVATTEADLAAAMALVTESVTEAPSGVAAGGQP